MTNKAGVMKIPYYEPSEILMIDLNKPIIDFVKLIQILSYFEIRRFSDFEPLHFRNCDKMQIINYNCDIITAIKST